MDIIAEKIRSSLLEYDSDSDANVSDHDDSDEDLDTDMIVEGVRCSPMVPTWAYKSDTNATQNSDESGRYVVVRGLEEGFGVGEILAFACQAKPDGNVVREDKDGNNSTCYYRRPKFCAGLRPSPNFKVPSSQLDTPALSSATSTRPSSPTDLALYAPAEFPASLPASLGNNPAARENLDHLMSKLAQHLTTQLEDTPMEWVYASLKDSLGVLIDWASAMYAAVDASEDKYTTQEKLDPVVYAARAEKAKRAIEATRYLASNPGVHGEMGQGLEDQRMKMELLVGKVVRRERKAVVHPAAGESILKSAEPD